MQQSFLNNGFQFVLKGTASKEFQPDNLIYNYDEHVSIAGLFQRMDNYLEKGMVEYFQNKKSNISQEILEVETVKKALTQNFLQNDELALMRRNHSAVMRELQRMQEEPGYISTWQPKTEGEDEEDVVSPSLC